MKLRTKLAFAMNVSLVGFCAYLVVDEIQKQKHQEEQAELIAAEVTKQAELAVQQAERDKQLQCLALNVYHEARNEGEQGQRAVAWATMNRTVNKHYPDTVCGVVHQAVTDDNGTTIRNKCQFSWYCDGKSDKVKDLVAWMQAEYVAADVMDKFGKETDPTGGAIMYHADYVDPDWADDYKREVEIDTHIFYVEN